MPARPHARSRRAAGDGRCRADKEPTSRCRQAEFVRKEKERIEKAEAEARARAEAEAKAKAEAEAKKKAAEEAAAKKAAEEAEAKRKAEEEEEDGASGSDDENPMLAALFGGKVTITAYGITVQARAAHRWKALAEAVILSTDTPIPAR